MKGVDLGLEAGCWLEKIVNYGSCSLRNLVEVGKCTQARQPDQGVAL